MQKTPYRLLRPQTQIGPVVFASPHSGRAYPAEFLDQSVLNEQMIRSSEDAYVDDLFQDAPKLGAPLLAANAPRSYIDLNRSKEELDPALIQDVRKIAHNPRVTSGLGVIPRVVANGRAIYRGKIPLSEARGRIHEVWMPYHTQLQSLLDETRRMFGHVVLIDCHSMPNEAIEAGVSGKSRKPQIVLGDRFGAAADSLIVDRVEAAFAAQDLFVARNTPFAGAYTAQHYGRPSRGQHVIQVEIDRSLYMDERRVRPHDGFAAFAASISRVIADLVEIGRDQVPLAAE